MRAREAALAAALCWALATRHRAWYGSRARRRVSIAPDGTWMVAGYRPRAARRLALAAAVLAQGRPAARQRGPGVSDAAESCQTPACALSQASGGVSTVSDSQGGWR